MSGANLGTYFRVKQIVGLKYCENICLCSWDSILSDKLVTRQTKKRLNHLEKVKASDSVKLVGNCVF